MATAVWDLAGRRARPAHARRARPAALPLRPGGARQPRGLAPRTRRRISITVAASLALGLLTTLPSALDLLDLAGPADGPEDGAEFIGAERHVVRPGDTIWDIAAEHVPEGTSVQDYVAEIILLNDIDPAELTPGSVLDLPAPEE